ncbi:MAG: glutathione S-transferase N-terminal domain-containing protein [Pseudomonadota bacterium]
MPTLYTMPGTCSLAPNIAIAWTEAPILITNLAYGDHKNDDYLAINPRGKVPALRFDDGDVLTEAAAILGYIRASFGGDISVTSGLGRKEAEALSYMTSEVHADFGPHFAAARYIDGPEAQDLFKSNTYDRLTFHFQFLEDTLNAAGDWYLGDRTFADAYLYVLTRWIDQTPLVFDEFTNLKSHRERMQTDPGVQAALARQDMQAL